MAEHYLTDSDWAGIQMLFDDYKRRKRTPPPRRQPPRESEEAPLYIYCAEEAPAFGCLRAVSFAVSSTTNQRILTGAKASTTFSHSFVLNGPASITANNYGSAQRKHFQIALYGDSTISVGDTIGPKPDSFALWKNYPGYRVLGIIDSTAKLALVVPEPILQLRAKADAAIDVNSSGTCSIWIGAAGSESDSTVNVSARTGSLPVLSTDDLLYIEFIDGQAYIRGNAQGFLGKTDSTHAKSASGTVSLWSGTAGSESDSTFNVTAYNKFADIGTGKWVWVEFNGKAWYITAAEC